MATLSLIIGLWIVAADAAQSVPPVDWQRCARGEPIEHVCRMQDRLRAIRLRASSYGERGNDG